MIRHQKLVIGGGGCGASFAIPRSVPSTPWPGPTLQAAIMVTQHLSYPRALEYVQRRRDMVEPNPSFKRQLKALEGEPARDLHKAITDGVCRWFGFIVSFQFGRKEIQKGDRVISA